MDSRKSASGELARQCEIWMRAGEGRRVTEALLTLQPGRLPRAQCLPLANLARRVNLVTLGLRILTPLIQAGEKGFRSDFTEAELAEYSMLLQKNGSTREALRILEGLLAGSSLPEVALYKAFCHLSLWDYQKAAPLFGLYSDSPGISPYQRLIGRLNLASVHVFQRQQAEARELLQELIPQAMTDGYRRLLANSLELMAQLDIQAGNFALAEARLLEALQTLRDEPTTDRLFLEKWLAVIPALLSGDLVPLQDFRARAVESRYWEGVRDADFYLAKAGRNEDLFRALYFGTSSRSYKEHLARSLPFALPEELLLGSGERCLDLETGELDGRVPAELRPGKKLHQFLVLLFSESYQPFRLGTIFGALFPEEHFHISSSPNRVHQIVSRSRELLRRLQLPMEIQEIDGSYRIALSRGCRVRRKAAPRLPSLADPEIARLRRLFGDSAFSARAAREELGLPLTSMNRVLSRGLETGILLREGSGKATCYRFRPEAAAPEKAA